MSHYITIPINENGIIFDGEMSAVIQEAIAVDPFGFDDVYIYSHGWSTDAYQALDEYNKFTVELAGQLLTLGTQKPAPPVFAKPPQGSLGVGIHWPSEITENPGSIFNALQLFTFYTMEHRADSVGRNAVYSILRSLLQARTAANPLRIFLLGHSFGCKVICAALQDLQPDMNNGTISAAKGTTFRVVLLEPATDNDNLQKNDIYGNIVAIPDLRLLVTKSALDIALNTWFPAASKAANLFKAPKQALGAAGPSGQTLSDFGTNRAISITSGFTPAGAAGFSEKLIVADLTPVHTDRKNANVPGAYVPVSSGSHSDISFDEVYNMIAGFFFS